MAAQLKPAGALNPANGLTLLRLVLAPVFALFLMRGDWKLAFAAFSLAALTDLLDGWLARRFGWVTPLGVFIDPLADKALQLTAFTLLASRGDCPDWVAVLAWARELLVVTGFALLALVAEVRTVSASRLGKAGTLAQMLALAALLGGRAGGLPPAATPAVTGLLGAAVLLNFAAGLEYALRGLRAYEIKARGGKPRG